MVSRYLRWWPRRGRLSARRLDGRDLEGLAFARRASHGIVEAVLRACLRTDRGGRLTHDEYARLTSSERQALLATAIGANARIMAIDIFRATRRIDVRRLLRRPLPAAELESLAAVFVDAYLEADIIAAHSLRASAAQMGA